MLISVDKFFREPLPPPNEEDVLKLVEFLHSRLTKTGYKVLKDKKEPIDKLVRFFAEAGISSASQKKYDYQIAAIKSAEKKRKIDYVTQVPPLVECRFRKPNKGFLFCGTLGTGKTALIQRLAAGEQGKTEPIPYFKADDMAEMFQKDGEEAVDAFLNETEEQTIVIDDLGSERYAKRYGSEPIMPYILEKRYRCFQEGFPTIIVTNLDKSGLEEEYGARITSRLAEMCEKLILDGQDWRTK